MSSLSVRNGTMRSIQKVGIGLVVAMLLGACAIFQTPTSMAKTFTVHNVYGDHMVLQCNRPIKISGTATPGESVKVTLGKNSAWGTANDQGEWVAVLPAMPPSMDAYKVTVSGSETVPSLTFSDVLIGEVWLASGQSNMSFTVLSSTNGKFEADYADYPKIRLYNTRRVVSPGVEQKESPGPCWEVCTPNTVRQFSAIGYFFARTLQRDLNVPVGVINSSWGGTPVESWISESGYAKANRTTELAKIEAARNNSEKNEAKVKDLEKKALEQLKQWEKGFYGFDPDATEKAKAWRNRNFDDSAWQDESLPSSPASSFDGIFWYRQKVNIPAEWAGKELTLSLGAIDDCDETYFNGQLVGATDSSVPNYWTASRYYKIPADLVKAGTTNTIAVRVADMFGEGGMLGPEQQLYVQVSDDPTTRIKLGKVWKYQVEFKIDTNKIGVRPAVPAPENKNASKFPSTLYNSMVAPWIVYPIRGAIWYQGESNAGRYIDYMTLFPLLINDWREKWNDPTLPFLFVQLAAFERHSPKARGAEEFWKTSAPSDTNWPKLREVQTATLAMPNTGMAVAIDIGDAYDIHPRNKQTVGYRLAKEAERICYGSKAISAGPMFQSMDIEGNKVRLHFTNVGSGLIARDGELGAFSIADKSGKFVWAQAMIEGDTVVVWSDKVAEPVEVRYAWSGYPGNANLFNQEGFPACPFRTAKPDYLLK